MTKRITRERTFKLSDNDLLKIAKAVKENTSYGIAGAPMSGVKRTPPRREVSYGENRSRNYKKKVTFKNCETIAENNVILRTAIEYNKASISNASYDFLDINSKETNPNIETVKKFFRFPDGENSFKSFLKQLIEDMLVTDTVSVTREFNSRDKTLSISLIDGTTIQPIVDHTGKTISYQMFLNGSKEPINIDKTELIYHITNKRTKEKYGYSKVAQAYTVATLFDKAMRDIEDYYDGNVGNYIAAIKGLNATEKSVEILDLLTGFYEERRNGESKHNLTLFAEADFHKLKDVDLKNNIHDFYIRMICAIFNVPYQYFVAEINRATAETSQNITELKGMRDTLDNIEEIINKIIVKFLKIDDVIFKFIIDVPIDADKQATRLSTLVNNKILTVNEARAELGYSEIEGGDTFTQEQAPSPASDDQEQDQAQEDDKEDLKKSAKDPEIEQAFKEAEEAFALIFADLLDSQKNSIVEAIRNGETINEDFLKSLELTDTQAQAFIDEFSVVAQKVSVTYLSRLNDIYNINNVKAFTETIEEMELYVTERAAELVGKQIRNGVVVNNPNPAMSINETTRKSLKNVIAVAMETGKSNQELAKEIEESFDFSKERALKIARYETNHASNFTAMTNYAKGGIKQVVWSTAYNDSSVCETCIENERQGPINLGDVFKSGVKHPPEHPNCKCTLNPYFPK